MPAPDDTSESAAPAQPVRRVYAFVAYPSHRSRLWLRTFLATHLPRLWEEIRVKWLPTARPIPPHHLAEPERVDSADYVRGYSREILGDLLVSLGEQGTEWDGYLVCSMLEQHRGWQVDFHLAAIVHAWSKGLASRMGARAA